MATRDDARGYLKRSLLILAVSVAVIVLLAYLARMLLGARLESASRYLTDTLGYFGVFLTIWTIDTFTLPVSPDFVLAFVAHPGSQLDTVQSLVAVCAASVIGGICAYYLSRWIGKTRFVWRLLKRRYAHGHALFEYYGVWTVVIAGLTPIPFSIVCWFAGLYRMAAVPLALACLSRIPRFVAWFYLIKLGYSL